MPLPIVRSFPFPLASASVVPELAAQLGHSLQVLFSTYAHVVEDLRGSGKVDAEAEIRSARKLIKQQGVAQKLPRAKSATDADNAEAADSA